VDTPAPAALSDLIAAGLVSHEMIGDPAKLGAEAGCLRALCALIGGPVYRIEAYHYAFRAGPGDLDGRLATLAPGEWTGAIETALCAALGEDAVWVNTTDLLPEADALLAQPILLLRAQDAALAGALETAGPGLQAVVNARYAAECARLTMEQAATAGEGALADRLAAIESRQNEILDALAVRSGSTDEALANLSQTLAVVLQHLEAQAELLHGHITRQSAGSREQDGADMAATVAAFQKTLGLTFAEFLARIEQRSEADRAAIRVSQYS
jgi:hypothetical protein